MWKFVDIPGTDGPESYYKGPHYQLLEARPDFGVSLYDRHSDLSGTVYSSTKRPVPNMRPDYIHWGFKGPRGFSADTWFIGFLDRELGADNYDVITDHDISSQGPALLQQYKVLLSASHPEYQTFSVLDAYTTFLDTGGRFLYLGGNGYYWVTTHDSERTPHRIEVRRGGLSSGSFFLPPGEHHHSQTGEFGGIWSSRGRSSCKLFGLTGSAVGIGKGAPYGIAADVRQNPATKFLFQGSDLEDTKIIGDFGLLAEAASGDELDRMEISHGTPTNVVLLGSSKLAGGHSDKYAGGIEDLGYPMESHLGTQSSKVRSDLIYFDTPSGGAVFAVGSINWIGSMAWNGYSNNVAQITRNALHEFLRRP